MKILLNDHVKFIRQDLEEAWNLKTDESGWQDVVLPHDWAVSCPFDRNCSSGTGYLPGGTGWYRIHFDLPAGSEDKNISVFFEGVYKHASVWCNQYYLGKWANGYTSFSFDLTGTVRERNNVLSVRVSHEDISDSRWYTGSGIERPVYLQIREKVFADEYDSSMETLMADENHAQLRLCQAVRNSSDRSQHVSVRSFLGGTLFCEMEQEIPAGEEKILEYTGILEKPDIWSLQNPVLTEWKMQVTADNEVMEETVICTGIRTFRFDPDQGFSLNGVSMKLKGVCLHEDAGSFGNAVPENVWKRRLLKLQKMGANTIRMSHNPHSEALYRLCDELGLLVIDEAFDEWQDPKNKWWQGHNVYPPRHQGYFLDYPQWHEKDIASFVKARRSHPCVIMWSIGNEIDYPNDPYCHESFAEVTGNNDNGKPLAERRYDPDKPDAARLVGLARDLAELVRKYDTTRPVSLASAFPELSSKTGLFGPLDVIGYNYKEQFYEADHKRFPDQPIFGSENGHDLAAWKAVTEHPYIAGQCLWTGIDYLGETGGWPEHGSRAGHLTTAGFEKEDYYFRQSLWTGEPMIRLCVCEPDAGDWMELRRHSWNGAQGTLVRAEVYTNLPQAELFLNGRSLGRQVQKDEKGKFVWVLPYESGELKAAGYRSDDSRETVTDMIRSQKQSCRLGLRLLEQTLLADGSSIGQIQIDVLDADGNLQTEAEDLIEAEVSGQASFLHMDNGNLADTTPYTSRQRRAYDGHLMLYIRASETPGEVVISAGSRNTGRAQLRFRTEAAE